MNKTLPLNIQFFAEEESVETQEVAEPVTAENEDVQPESETSEQTQEVAEPVQSREENARYAAARRKADEEVKRINERYSSLFSNYVNPKTGKPITSAIEYADVIEMQNRLAIENQLKQSGVDPTVIQQFIANDPTVRQAQAVIEQQKAVETDMRISSDIQAINKINPDIKSVEDLSKDEKFTEIYERWQKSNMTESLYDIYRLVNFDKLTAKKAEAAKQAAINQAKGKNHLETSKGVSTSDNMVDIPANELSVWKEAYPELSMSQLREKYNKTL